MKKTMAALTVAATLLAGCASPTSEPISTSTPPRVAVKTTATPLPSGTPAPSATTAIRPANDACVRATTEIPEGRNPTHFLNYGPPSGCYDSVGGFLDDIGLAWGEFVPGTQITFWTQWPVHADGRVVYPTATPIPLPRATSSPIYVSLGSPFPSEWGTPQIWSNDSFNSPFDPDALDDHHGHVDISVPAGYSVVEGFDVDAHTGDVRAPVAGMITAYELGLEITLPNNTYPDEVL